MANPDPRGPQWNDATLKICGTALCYLSAHMVLTHSDQGEDGTWDIDSNGDHLDDRTGRRCQVQPGDSGGAVYHGYTTGGRTGVRVKGIITSTSGNCVSGYTNLAGLRAYYAAAGFSIVHG